jgi:hypothetical protein
MSLSHIGKNKGENNPSFVGKYKFIHPIYGTEILGQCELIEKYNFIKEVTGLVQRSTVLTYQLNKII